MLCFGVYISDCCVKILDFVVLVKLLSAYHLVWCFVVHEEDQGEDGDHGEDQEPDV